MKATNCCKKAFSYRYGEEVVLSRRAAQLLQKHVDLVSVLHL